MGRATESKVEQVTYLKRRTKLLADVVATFEVESVDISDLENVLDMLKKLQIKVERFKKDWEKETK